MTEETNDPWAPTKQALGKVGWFVAAMVLAFILWGAFTKAVVPRALWGQAYVNEPVTAEASAYGTQRVLLTTRCEFQKNVVTITRRGADAGGARVTATTKFAAKQVQRDNPLATYVLTRGSYQLVIKRQAMRHGHLVLTCTDGRKLTFSADRQRFTTDGVTYQR